MSGRNAKTKRFCEDQIPTSLTALFFKRNVSRVLEWAGRDVPARVPGPSVYGGRVRHALPGRSPDGPRAAMERDVL